MLQLLSELRHKVAIGFVGGSNLDKQQEQLATPDINVTSLFDFCFAENGLTAYRLGEELPSQSFISWIGQEQYNKLVKWYVPPMLVNCSSFCAQLSPHPQEV
jgi:phosphomannomutase